MSSFLIDVKGISQVKLGNYNIDEVLKEIQQELDKDIALPHSLKSLIKVLLIIVPLLCQRLGLNSRNSSKPPSSDPNRDKKKAKSSQGKHGGQKGHKGSTLEQVAVPDHVELLQIDRHALPEGDYKNDTPEKRQVVDIDISVEVTEYQAEVLVEQLLIGTNMEPIHLHLMAPLN